MRIKICGITRVEDARAAVRAGADLIGLNFYPPSPRYIGSADVPALMAAIEPPAIPVAVAVDPDKTVLSELIGPGPAIGKRPFPVVQLSGKEPASLANWLIDRGVKVIKTFHVADEAFAAGVGKWLKRLRNRAGMLAVLLDTASGNQYGGTGRRFNWEWIVSAREAGELTDWPPLMLAGGLKPANVAKAVRIAQPWGVDVAGGVEVEDSPGIKSVDKIRDFIRNARTGER